MIIGISGHKQAGKTTFSNILKKYILNKRIETINMSDNLKRTVIEYFIPTNWGISIEDLNFDEVKNRTCPCGKTIRQLLQIVGTDMFRSIDINYAFQPYINKIKFIDDNNTIILTPDIRFPNEIDLIHKHGGIVIRLLRKPIDDPHESEHALDQIEFLTNSKTWDKNVPQRFDYIIDNSNFTLEQLNEAAKIFVDNILKGIINE